MKYLNDVFISYKRSQLNEQWMEEIFLPLFREYLNNLLEKDANIFIDKTGLTNGADFNNELFKNLVYSKSFVSVWSPPYFRKSEWCIKEFLTMKYQQQLYNISTDGKPSTLIWPIVYRKLANPLPPIINNINYLDYSDFNVVGDAFFKTELYIKFQFKLQNDIQSIADIIINAPELHEDLKTIEGKKKVQQEINDYLITNDITNESIKQSITSW